MTVAEVLAPGLHSTVQDLGRVGQAHLGVPRAGALDPLAVALANRCVGNPPDAAVLECTLRGPALRFSTRVAVAALGALPLTVDGVAQPLGWAATGREVTLGSATRGLRGWLAVAGGFATEPVLGSRSADTLSGLGGRPLRSGDRLPVATSPLADPVAAPGWPPLPGAGPTTVRVTAGPHPGAGLAGLLDATWTVTPRADRTGLRLDGPVLPGGEVASQGLVAGAVQVPPDGRPVVLLANHQTTGGYEVAAVVAAADLPLLAQARPGARLRFRLVGVAGARAAYDELRTHLLS